MPALAESDALELSVVMPCLNEALTLAGCIREARAAFDAAGIAGEIIVADNGSTDGSPLLAEREGARVVHVSAKGYGSALKGGIAAARGRFVVMGDADLSYNFGEIGPILERLRAGADLVMGNRFKGGIHPGAMPWKNRYIGNPVLSTIGRLFFDTPIRDFHCGLRGFSKSAYVRMELRTTGMEFASEMVIKAMLLGLRVDEVPVSLRPDGRNRPPHLRPWRDGWRHLRFMLLFSPRWLFFYPGLLLIAMGSSASAVLLRGPVSLGEHTFDLGAFLFAILALLVGCQSAAFAVFSKIYAINTGLRPDDPQFSRLFRWLTLEVGLLFGAALLALGLGLSVYAVSASQQLAFGPVDSGDVLRAVAPGAVCMLLGSQAILGSFFLSVLGLKPKQPAVA